jgi:hypothetical protein
VLAGGLSAASASEPDIPQPSLKPLQDLGNIRFVAGSDAPARKPQFSIKPKDDAENAAVCVLPFAVFSSALPIHSDKGCGFEDTVVLMALKPPGGETIRLSSPVTVTCSFAETFSEWVAKDVQAIAKRILGSPLALIASGPGYQCRRRNNRPDGKLSEHALGKAIDITAFQVAGGRNASVESHWTSGNAPARFLKEVHAAACRKFPTVLGPDADPHHTSHFHLDTGCHGQDCTYLICQ